MPLPTFVQDFNRDFNQFLRTDLEPFAFVRFGDGEYHVIEQLDYRSRSGWTVDGGQTWIQFPLIEALTYTDPGYFIGISAPCDHPESASSYRNRIRGIVPKSHTTFGSIFAHFNYGRMSQIRARYENPVIVGSTERCEIKVPSNGMAKSWDVDAIVDQLRQIEGRPIFLAAGPCSNVIIHRYWMRQPPEKRVTIIDIGAAFDEQLHGKVTRDYHKKHGGPPHKCGWEDWKPFQPLTDRRREAAARKHTQTLRFAQLRAEGFVGARDSRGSVREQKSHTAHIKDRRPPGPANNRNMRVRTKKK